MAFVYQKLLHSEISEKHSKIKEFSFCKKLVKRKAFELTYDCLILYNLMSQPVIACIVCSLGPKGDILLPNM